MRPCASQSKTLGAAAIDCTGAGVQDFFKNVRIASAAASALSAGAGTTSHFLQV